MGWNVYKEKAAWNVFVWGWEIATGSAKLYLLDWVTMGWNGFSRYSSNGLRWVRHTF